MKEADETPGWRDPERAAQNWRDCAKYLRRYVLALALPGIVILWAAGYGKGLIDGFEAGQAATRNETQGVE